MKVTSTNLPEVLIIEPNVFGDNRGCFKETWQLDRYRKAGIELAFVQDNISVSQEGVLRGLHYQYPYDQGKLVQALSGKIVDVAVDIRVGSPTFGKHAAVELSAENHKQLYIPPGFAHGFCVVEGPVIFSYKCTDFFNKEASGGVAWNDPDIEIAWPVSEPQLSDADKVYPRLRDIPQGNLPSYGAGQ